MAISPIPGRVQQGEPASSAGGRRRPLAGVRVIDLGQVFSVPFAGAMLADLGAEVIKIEGPDRLDVTRMNGVYADADPGADSWNRSSMYNAVNRGKKSLVLDLGQAEGRDILRALIAKSDIVMENFTPRVMKKWGLDYTTLSAAQPGLIMVSNTGYGHGAGPYAEYPAQATTQEATHGLTHITGYADGPPSKAGASYIDFLAANACLSGVALALRQRRRTGQGQWIEVGMYQIGCYTTSEYILDWMSNRRQGERIGNRHPWLAPQGCYPCAGEDQWCVLSVQSDAQWAALCTLMGQPELAADARFAHRAARHENHDALDAPIADWTRGRSRAQAMQALQGAGIPAHAVLDARDVHHDTHLRARGFLEPVAFAPERRIGERLVIGRPWTFSRTAAAIAAPAPAFGQHNRELLGSVLGFDVARLDALEQRGVTASEPVTKPVAAHVGSSVPEMVRMGVFQAYDPDYRGRAGAVPSASRVPGLAEHRAL